jgi:Phosphotransferase enzyme family
MIASLRYLDTFAPVPNGYPGTIQAHETTERGCVGVGVGEQLATGSRSAVFAWGRNAVAKVPFAATPEAWIHFEALYTAAVHDAGAPAPRFMGIEMIDGRAAGIYERVHGRSMWDHMLEDPAQVATHTRSLAELQADVFALVPPVALPAQRDRLTCKIRAASARVDRSLVAALELLPPATPSRLCHGDLHPGNVIMASDGPVIIDWFDAARGDHVADIARTSLLMSTRAHGPTGPGHLPGAQPDMLDRVRQTYLDAITDLVHPDPDAVRRWEAVVAVARVAEGIATDALLDIWREWRAASPAEAGAVS